MAWWSPRRHDRASSRPSTSWLLAQVDSKDVDARHKAGHDENLGLPPLVIRGLDPRIHLLRKMDCRVKPGNDETGGSIPIMIRLERAFRLHADILSLVLAQFGQLHPDLGEMQPR